MKLKIYFIKISVIFICLISLVKVDHLKAEVKVTTTSMWELWNLTSFDNNYGSHFYLTGNTKALLVSNEDYNKIKLYVGINSSRDGNFNYITGKETLLYGNLFLDADIQDSGQLSVGFRSGDLSKTNILISKCYSFGLPLLPLYINYKTVLKDRVVFDGSYMQTNEAFSITYNQKVLLGKAKLGVSYIPNLDYNLSNNRSYYRDLQKSLGALDAYINYYDEYQDIGYGLIGGVRIYSRNVINPEGTEFFVSPNIDYLGFGFSLSFLSGTINGYSSNISYQLSEVTLCYNILKYSINASYGYNTITNNHTNKGSNYYNNLNLSVGYLLNSKFTINSGIFYNKASYYKSNKGVALGFSIKV